MGVFTKILFLDQTSSNHSPRGREGSYDEVIELVLGLLSVKIVILKQFQKLCECSRKTCSLIKQIKLVQIITFI